MSLFSPVHLKSNYVHTASSPDILDTAWSEIIICSCVDCSVCTDPCPFRIHFCPLFTELVTDFESKKTNEELRKASDEEISKLTEEHRKGKEIELNNTLIDEVARVQIEIATTNLREWEKREKEASAKKIDDFIK